jgi:integrase
MLTDWIVAYLAFLAAGGAAALTIRLRRTQLTRLARDVDLETVTEEQLVAWLEAHGGQAPNTRKSTVTTLRGFFRWAKRTGRRPDDPTEHLPAVRVPAGVPRPIPEDAFRRAYGAAEGETRAMLALGYFGGLRRAEIARVHGDDITDGWLLVHGKGGKTRRVPIAAELRPYLAGVTGWMFPSPVRPGQPVGVDYVEDRVTRAIGPYTCHQLRHAAASRWYSRTRDIRAVQLLLGHASVATTQVYVSVDDAALLAAVA